MNSSSSLMFDVYKFFDCFHKKLIISYLQDIVDNKIVKLLKFRLCDNFGGNCNYRQLYRIFKIINI
jgi:hypothetical protein